MMKQSIWTWESLLGFGVALAISAGAGHAADDLASDGEPNLLCDVDFVAGVYGFNFDLLGEPAEAGVGVLQLRSNGAVRLKMEGFVEGATSPLVEFLWGTWEVRPDCTGTMSTSDGASWTFVAVENANELFLVSERMLEEADAKRLVRR